MFEWIVGKLIATPVIGTLITGIGSIVMTWQKQKLDAQGTLEQHQENIAVKTLALDQREAELNAAMVVAEQGNWITRNVRPGLALPVIIIMFKLLVWDKALGQWTGGHTDPLDAHMWSYVNTVVIAYMGGRSLEKVADKISGVFKK